MEQTRGPVDVASREEVFGRYRLKRRVATGGMAEVYDAELQGPLGFRRRVALKRILPHLAKDGQFVRAFVSEARLCGLLIHPNIVQIVDFDFVQGVPYIAMEFVEGGHLGRLVARARANRCSLPIEMVVALMGQVARGIEFAHQATDPDGSPLRIIHRDLKPPNVLLGLDGIARIGDFGIARASSNLTHTRPDMVKGSIPYMSPEQARCSPALTPASDLFAIGALLFELLTLERLFPPGANALGMLARVAQGPEAERLARLSTLPDTARPLEPLVRRLLKPRPEQRYPDAAAFIEAVEKLAYPQPSREQLATFAREWLVTDAPSERALPALEMPAKGEMPANGELTAKNESPRSPSPPATVLLTQPTVSPREASTSSLETELTSVREVSRTLIQLSPPFSPPKTAARPQDQPERSSLPPSPSSSGGAREGEPGISELDLTHSHRSSCEHPLSTVRLAPASVASESTSSEVSLSLDSERTEAALPPLPGPEVGPAPPHPFQPPSGQSGERTLTSRRPPLVPVKTVHGLGRPALIGLLLLGLLFAGLFLYY